MSIKSVLVRLKGDNSDLNRALLGSAAASKVLGDNLDSADKSSRGLSDALETSNDRTTMLVQSALALGPAFVPLGAQAVPIVMGLATQLTFAAGAAGVTVLALSGVGDALKAVNEYAIDPSVANFEKMHEEMDKLGPAGQDFVMYLQELRPQLQRLQDIAQAGLLPGATEGIDELMTQLPEAERIVGTFAETMGDLLAQGGGELAGPEFEAFFDYVENEARPILTEMAQTFGNFVKTFANLVVAFGPLTSDFSGDLLQTSRDIEAWSDGLAESTGFQEFSSYIRETGPEVWETLGALATALLAVVEAAAPVGQASLPVIEAIADTLAAIAKSPAGPVLIGAAAGLSAVSRAVALYKVANGSALLGLITGGGKDGAKAALGYRAAGAGLGMLALSLTDVDEKMGLSNTAMYAAMGLIAGPWGAALGGGIGLAMDFASANDDVAEAVDNMNEALEYQSATFGSYNTALGQGKSSMSDYLDGEQAAVESFTGFLKHTFSPGGIKTNLDVLFGGFDSSQLGQTLDAYEEAADKQDALGLAGDLLAKRMNVVDASFSNAKIGTEQWDEALRRAAPAMNALGITVDDLVAGVSDGSILTMVGQIEAWTRQADSAAGRTHAVRDAIAGLGDEMISTSASADVLKTSLDALIDPNLNLVRSTDQWTTQLRHLEDDLSTSSKTLRGNSDAAIQNREAINQRVDSLKQLLGAEADAGASSAQLSRKLSTQRQNLIEAGVAAGISRGQMRDYINTLGLTPKLVRTLVEARTERARAAIEEIRRQALDVERDYRINFIVTQTNSINRGHSPEVGIPSHSAEGGFVPKTGLPYADRHPYLLADGEGVTTNRRGETDRFRDVIGGINAGLSRAQIKGMLADGGFADFRNARPALPNSARIYSRSVEVSALRSAAHSGMSAPAPSLAGLRIEGRVEVDGREGYLRGVIRDEMAAEKRFDRLRTGG